MQSTDRLSVRLGGLFRRNPMGNTPNLGSEDQFMPLFAESIRTTSDGLALTDVNGTFLWANDGMCRLTGYSLEEIVGQTPKLFKSGIQPRSFYQHLWTTILEGNIFNGEIVNKRKDGSLYTGQITITPLKNDRGAVTHFTVMERDISKRIALEESLREGQDRFRQLVESMSDGLAWLDENEIITYANPVFLTKLGYTAEELIGTNFLSLLDDEYKTIVQRQTIERRKGTRLSYDLEINNKSGLKKIFRISPSGLFNIGGEFAGSFAIFRDVTHEREIEAKLLEAKVQAELLNRFQASILDNINHEFRTPLSGILGFADVLSENVGEEDKEFVRHIQEAGKRLMQTLNSVVDMSALLSNKTVLNIQPCNVNSEVLQVVANLRPKAEAKGLSIKTINTLARGKIQVDAHGLVQIAEHLIGNAIKFTEQGAIRVELRESNEAGFFELVVQDTGIGISPASQQHIFDLFRQESIGVAREYEGIGLGLSFSNILVNQMGGWISLTSDKSFGSEFVVTLPKSGQPKGSS